MLAAPTASPIPDGDILVAFKAQVDECKGKNYEGRTFYHPVARIKEWMLKGKTLGKLLQAVYQKEFARAQPSNIGNAVIVFAILLSLDCGKWIHVFKQYFDDNNLDKSLDESLRNSLAAHLEGDSTILDEFDEKRWAFNPAKLEDMCAHAKAYTGGQWILPFCRKEKVGEGGTATVHGVLVPEGLVPDKLKTKLREKDPHRGYEFKDRDFGLCYQFAIKSYSDKNRSVFDTETSNFVGMKDLEGVVECFGGYTEEKANQGSLERTHNILLEYGDQDLDEYLALNQPPVLASEIIEFWENIFGVATTLKKVHKFRYEGPGGDVEDFNGWHGDVKPSNILFSQGKFKLADFGFAKFKFNEPGKIPSAYLVGVTYTYGAPECDSGRLRKGTMTPQTQKIDTWSFGCLLSSVATWVVLGSDAYSRQYPGFRKLAMIKLAEVANGNGGSDGPRALDGFHDGHGLLPAVVSWHRYLKNTIRKSDPVTHGVIHLIESHMLRSNPENRLSFEGLTDRLDSIIKQAKKDQEALPPPDPEFLEAMLRLDDMAPPDINLQARPGDASSSQEFESLGVMAGPRPKTAKRTERVKKTDRIEEMVVPAKVAGRRRVLETQLRSLNKTYIPPSVVFERARGVSESPLQSGTGFDHGLALPPSAVAVASGNEWELEPTPPTTGMEEKIALIVHSPEQMQTPDHAEDRIPAHDNPFEPNSPNGVTSPSSGRSSFIAADQASPLLQRLVPERRSGSILSLPARSSRSASIDWSAEFSQYPIGQLRAKLDKEMSGRSFFAKLQNKLPTDIILKNFIYRRDIIFLVDNGWSMRDHWREAEFVLVTLAMNIGALDDDGVDLLFTRSAGCNKRNAKGTAIEKTFSEAMRKAAVPEDSGGPRHSHVLFATEMEPALAQILRDYRKDRSKKLTVIILTTGVWTQNEGSDDVEQLLAQEIRDTSEALENYKKERWLTVQFVSFGQDPVGLKRLNDLDDEFSSRYKVPDVIDTEPWQGEPQKMLLGSIHDSMDQQNTPASGGAYYPSDGASSHLGEPGPAAYRGPPSPDPRTSVSSFPIRTGTKRERDGSKSIRKFFGSR
ncbi:hypothetical protein OQA88_1113 [Cercophora sp. LCS_1]